MEIIDIVGIIALCMLPGLPILALLLSAYAGGRTNSRGPSTHAPGPKCDICGRYLKDHGMWECEMYC